MLTTIEPITLPFAHVHGVISGLFVITNNLKAYMCLNVAVV